MSHLPTERLAALVDESPTAAELAHLAGCAECVRERAVFRALADLSAGESAQIGTPLTSWEKLAPALVADGVIDDGRSTVFTARRTSWNPKAVWLQAAAAMLIAAAGMAAGRYTAGANPLAITTQASGPVADTSRFKSVDDARQAQAQSYALYQSATAFIAQRDTGRLAPDSPGAMRARLAALDRANAAMGQALTEAPYDPVINGYYLTTQGQREATIRQLNTVMPASMRIQSY